MPVDWGVSLLTAMDIELWFGRSIQIVKQPGPSLEEA